MIKWVFKYIAFIIIKNYYYLKKGKKIFNKHFMNLQVTNARLLDEVKTLTRLLKMKVRVENGSNEIYTKVMIHLDNLIRLEEKANDQSKYYNELDIEVNTLRKTCEKYSELSESVQLLTVKNKKNISQLKSDNKKLNEDIADIRYL